MASTNVRSLLRKLLVFGSFVLIGVSTSMVAAGKQPTGSDQMPSMNLVDAQGRSWTNDDFNESDVLIVAFLGTECPLAKLYAPRLQQIVAEKLSTADAKIGLIGVFSNRQDSLLEMDNMKSAAKVDYLFAKDPGGRFASDTGATRTPEVFLYDRQRKLRYQGQIDDQFGIGFVHDAPKNHSLRDAIGQLLAGESIETPFLSAPGCLIGFPPKGKAPLGGVVSNPSNSPLPDSPPPAGMIDYHSDIQPILQQHCTQCHQQGEIAPFSLTDFESAEGWADMMVEVIDQGRMPPWHATNDGVKFANDRSMPESDKQLIRDWAESGANEGLANIGKHKVADSSDDLSNQQSGPSTLRRWQLPRDPDLIYSISPQPVAVQASGTVRYRYYTVDPKLDHDVWFDAAELRPGNPEVVHHILCFAIPPSGKVGLEAVNGFLVGYVPGARVEKVPDGYAKRLPAGHQLLFQVHYTPIGRETTDQSELAICLTDVDSVTREIRTASAVQMVLDIPPGEKRYQTHAVSSPFPAGAELLSMSPHMHVRGSSYRYELEQPNGEMKTLLDIPQYDFNWQTTYVIEDPLVMSGGERMFCTATFNNSVENPANPDPSSTVHWGDQTWDEMMIGYFHYAVDRDSDAEVEFAEPAKLKAAALYGKFNDLDRDKDGRVERKDAPQAVRGIFDAMDADGDRVVTRREAVLYRH